MEPTFTPQPHTEAAAIVRGKPAVVRSVFDGLLPELRGRVFTISGVEAANVLQRVQDLIAATAEGETWDDAKQNIVTELDPFLGAGADRRAEILLRTHGFQAFQASNWRVAQEDDDTTHLQYLTMEDDRVRPGHAALEGVILPKDDPFWQTHFPPWEWGCRCRTRPMNPDLVDEAKQADESRAPDDKLVLEGPALRKLNEGQIVRNGQATSVLPPEGDNAFHWHPDDLRLSLAELKERYDASTWQTFETMAKGQEILPGQTLWEWLDGAAPATETKKTEVVAADRTGADSLISEMKAQKFKPETIHAINSIPAPVTPLLKNLHIKGTTGGAFYQRHATTMTVNRNPEHWSGHPMTVLHETGHHVHYESGIITNTHTSPEFAAAMEKDRAGWEAWMKERHGAGSLAKYKTTQVDFILRDLADAMGLPMDSNNDLVNSKRVSRVADTIMGLTFGKYGLGHKIAYMRTSGHMEVFAHTFSALVDKDEFFAKLFPNVLAVVTKALNL